MIKPKREDFHGLDILVEYKYMKFIFLKKHKFKCHIRLLNGSIRYCFKRGKKNINTPSSSRLQQLNFTILISIGENASSTSRPKFDQV